MGTGGTWYQESYHDWTEKSGERDAFLKLSPKSQYLKVMSIYIYIDIYGYIYIYISIYPYIYPYIYGNLKGMIAQYSHLVWLCSVLFNSHPLHFQTIAYRSLQSRSGMSSTGHSLFLEITWRIFSIVRSVKCQNKF